MEEYFKFNNCEYVLVDVFAYNENAINFYNKKFKLPFSTNTLESEVT